MVAVMAAATADPTLPDIWKVVEDSYDSTLTINFPDLEVGTTMLVDELYDIKGKQGVVEVLSRGHTTINNYYTLSQQSFLVEGTMCTQGLVMMQDNYRVWGWIYDNTESPVEEQNFLYGPSALLRLVRDYGKDAVYLGETTVRDISAYHWSIPHTSSHHQVTYYFAADQWTMPYGHVLDGIQLQAPLMVKVEGPQGNPWNVEEGESNQTVYYEYTDFKPYVRPARRHRFLVREGLECKNRESLDPEILEPPTAPYQFQVFLETVIREDGGSEHQTIFRSWLYYSMWMQVIRLDINPGQDAFNPTAAYKSIHDYYTGIEYRIDTATGMCQIRPLEGHQLGNQLGSHSIGGVIMADPENLFHLDDSYMFNGYSETRGIKTSRWTSVRDDIYNPETGENFKKVVVDYQFNTEDVRTEGEKEGTLLPVRVDTTVYNDNNTNEILYRDTLNLLHMQTSFQEYDFNPFHVGECMDWPTEHTWLKITFAGDWLHGASQAPDAFKKKMIEYVAENTHSSYVRFAEVQLDHDLSDLVYGTMLILEHAPYRFQFNQLEDKEPTEYDTKILVNMHDVDACAYACLGYKPFECRSFYKCKGDGRTCYVSNYENSDGASLGVGLCPHYSKALLTETPVQEPNKEMEVILAAKILAGDFTIEMDYTDHEGNPQIGTYYAIAEKNEIFGDDPLFVDFLRNDFYPAYKQGKLLGKYTDLKITKVSYDVCLARCLGQVSFECETFSYCYEYQECMLSSEVVDTPPDANQLVQQTDCAVIIRTHTLDYTLMEGFVYLGEPKEIHTTLGVEKCAYLCDTANFTCRSFDFCLDSIKCSLYDHHTADSPDGMFNESKACMHYSRNALVDFTKYSNQMIVGTRDRYIKDTTPSACAQVCEDEPDFGCNGFDYCEEVESGVTCFLTEDHYSDDGTQISDSLTCDHYSRDYYEGMDRDSYAHNKKNDPKYKYGPGDMAGLGVSMLVISIALTFAGVYAYNKYMK